MEEKDSWKKFEMTGFVSDYLQYRQEYTDGVQKDERTKIRQESGRDYSTGYDTSERATGRV